MLTQELVRELFEYRDGELFWKKLLSKNTKIGSKAGSLHRTTGYYRVGIWGKSYRTHRLIYLYHHRETPKFLDHIDGNQVNNKIENLRAATGSQNHRNRKSCRGSKWMGVDWRKSRNRWEARTKINGVSKYIGRSECMHDAATMYNFWCYNNLPKEDVPFINYNVSEENFIISTDL